jgi:hypothetical protein
VREASLPGPRLRLRNGMIRKDAGLPQLNSVASLHVRSGQEVLPWLADVIASFALDMKSPFQLRAGFLQSRRAVVPTFLTKPIKPWL